MRKIRSIALFLALICCFGFIACSPKVEQNENQIEILIEGWLNQTTPQDTESNPYNKYLQDTYGYSFKFTNTSDMNTVLTRVFTSSSQPKPDIIFFQNDEFANMKSLYEQGFFVEDYTPYLADAPRTQALFADSDSHVARKFTENGNIIALTQAAVDNVWGFKIRQDWLDRFCGGVAPKTPEELLVLAEQVKNIAQASNGDPVYYLFTSSGKQEDLGRSLLALQNAWGYDDWYVDSSGNVSHPILDGNRESFLNFVKTVVENKYIAPNWYTDTWENHKTYIYLNNSDKNQEYSGRVGMAYYNSSIVTESVYFNNDDESKAEVWAHMDMPKAGSSGEYKTYTPEFAGKAECSYSYDKIIVVTKQAAANEKKMQAILKFLDDLLYPSDTYLAMRWGIGCDNYEFGDEVQEVLTREDPAQSTGYYAYYSQKNKDTHAKHQYGLIDYGAMCFTTNDKFIEYGTLTEAYTSPYQYIALEEQALDFNKSNAKTNYAELLNLNAMLYTNCLDWQREFEINYILGTSGYGDYDSFVDSWLEMGGSTLRSQAEAQFKAAGYIQ